MVLRITSCLEQMEESSGQVTLTQLLSFAIGFLDVFKFFFCSHEGFLVGEECKVWRIVVPDRCVLRIKREEVERKDLFL